MISSPYDVFQTFVAQSAVDPGRAIQEQWMSTSVKCKDVLVMAMPMKDIPVTKEAFTEQGASDFMRAQFYIVRVAPVDGQDWGWSNAPYDCAKKTPRGDLQALYTVDTQEETKNETRFWAFKKVSNNKNKGVRIEGPVDGVDTSFTLPRGTVLTFFIREDSFDAGKNVFVNAGEEAIIPAYTPVILQLSGTNGEQALKGNGLKLRRIMPLLSDSFAPFMDDLSSSKREAMERQDLARKYPAIANVAGRTATCPVVCSVLSGAFVHQDEDLERRGMLEIVDSGLELDVGSVLLMPTALLMAALHTEDFARAKRLLCVALGHGAVKCVAVPSDVHGEAVVVHVHVDVQKMLWLDTLHQMRASDRPAELPNTDTLVACFGRRMGSDANGVGFGSEGQHDVLQWYNPSKAVALASADGSEVMHHFVFEMDLEMKRALGVAEVPKKYFLMDEADGLHHSLRVFKVERANYTPETGLCTSVDPKIFITWQLRPTHGNCDTRALGGRANRKRPCYEPDEIDRINLMP
jgi:hypothetical protein